MISPRQPVSIPHTHPVNALTLYPTTLTIHYFRNGCTKNSQHKQYPNCC